MTESKVSSYSSFDNELQYTGAVHDDATGLLYLNARFYDPQMGRFISRDTYRGERDDASTWHLYLYCANNPVNYVDPSGHKFFTVYKYPNKKRYKMTMKLNWNDVQAVLTTAAVTANFIALCLGKLPEGMVSKAADTVFLTVSIVSGVTSLIIGKYLKNHALTVKLWFSYKNKRKTTTAHRQGKKYKITKKWVKIYNIRKKATLRG